jgi:hypothetical protein
MHVLSGQSNRQSASLGCCIQMVMDLKDIVSRLRKENRSLTNAFIWLCSGKGDWDTLVRTLPQHLCDQLPSTGPQLLTASHPVSACSASGSMIVGRNSAAAERTAPPTPDLPVTPGRPASPEPSRRRNRRLHCGRRSCSKSASGSGGGRPICGQDAAPSSAQGNNRQGLPYRFLEHFPELAALESEFQGLICQPETG